MSVRVLVSDYAHRTLALATETHVLLFKHVQPGGGDTQPLQPSSKQPKPDSPRCMVEFVEKSAFDLKGYRTLTTAKGTLGLITLGEDVFVCVATGSREVASVRPNETVQQIFAVEFYCLNRADYDHAGGYGAGYRDGYREPNPYSNTLFADENANGVDAAGDNVSEHPFMALKKLLSGGTFYYSYNFDLTRRLQDRADADSTLDVSSLDEGLLWNSYMINPLLSFRSRLSEKDRAALDHSSLLTSVIRGYAGTLTIPTSANPMRMTKSSYPATLTVISRLSSRRAGTRFNARGVDDDGNVANFVETETIFCTHTGICFSYVQVRGSIPLFWESASTLIPGQQKIQITRSPEATQLSFDRHFENLAKTYGAIHIVNLLSETKQGEVELTQRYNLHLARCSLLQSGIDETSDTRSEVFRSDILQKTEFDFHEQSRAAGGYDGAKKIKPLIMNSAEGFVYYLTQEIDEDVDSVEKGQAVRRRLSRPAMVMQQNGVFRTNCLDCLDRTNLIQGIISQMALELFLDHRGEIASSSNLSIFWMRHSSLWADNGDALSKIYAGTGALKSSFTRHGKMSFGGLMADARKSATRLYVNHFEDKGRQNTTDLLLGRLVGQEEVELVDPISDWVHEQLRKKADEFESSEQIKIWVGSYNLNGKMMKDASELHKWLDVRRGEGFGIVVVAFQEIVELSPQQIMNTDPSRRVIWETAVKQTINEHGIGKEGDQYILLRTGQLVGAALLIFVKVSMLSRIRNVEAAIRKTGMSGIAGNKGAVAIRMDVEGTSISFVTAHLAAGFGNYDERNRDYQTIISGLRFPRDRKIEDHEVVIWAGDFNYRIGTSFEKARQLIDAYRNAGGRGTKAEEALQKLYHDDQLNLQMVAGQTFPFYQEGKINFPPTYKFDLGKDDYDTSEKARIPAWTDRILYKIDASRGSDMRQVEYESVMNLRFSDHRPIYSTFDIKIRVIDEEKRSDLLKKLYAKRARQPTDNEIEDESDDSGDEADDLMGYQSVAPGLPPASSDKKKWWLDGDKPIASNIKAPQEGMVLNLARSGNPWREGNEDDWILVDKDIVGKEKTKPEPPAPRKTRNTDTNSIQQEQQRELEERVRTPPPKPPPPRNQGSSTPPSSLQPPRNNGINTTSQTVPSSTNQAPSFSRNPSLTGSISLPHRSPSTTLPPSNPNGSRSSTPSSRLSNTQLPPQSSFDRDSLTYQPASASRTPSVASTSTTNTICRKAVPPPKPAKPSSLTSISTPPLTSSQPQSQSQRTSSISQPQSQDQKDSSSLRSMSPRPMPIDNDDNNDAQRHNVRTQVAERQKQRQDQGQEKPPPLPRRQGTNTSTMSAISSVSGGTNGSKPALPPRRDRNVSGSTTVSSAVNRASYNGGDLLGDNDTSMQDGEGEARDSLGNRWKPLIPDR